MQWLTSKKGDKLIAMEGGNPSRFSTHQDAEANEKFPHLMTFGEALADADPDWRPIIPPWGEINSELGTTLNKAHDRRDQRQGGARHGRRAHRGDHGRRRLLHLAEPGVSRA